MAKSIEEKIEFIAKEQLKKFNVKTYGKNESVNPDIDNALKKALSKGGGNGGNFPDIKAMICLPKSLKQIPIMIEVKGTKGALIKEDDGIPEIYNKKGEEESKTIAKYAVNGAIHYAEAIVNYTSFKEVIAIGFNGYEKNQSDTVTEMGVYYVSHENLNVPKKIAEFSDFSFLQNENLATLEERIADLLLTDEEREKRATLLEIRIDTVLRKLNQDMEDVLKIKDEHRVRLVCGLIMAALGVKDKVSPLQVDELKGEMGANSNDSAKVLQRINDYVDNKPLPEEKRKTIKDLFSAILRNDMLYTPRDGKSAIRTVYEVIKDDLMPIYESNAKLDFTGELFNVLNSWIKLRPGDEANDVVLTPRYVTDLMARLCKVNKNSYVWDYTAGSGGFLISAMKLMIEDAKNTIKSERDLQEKIRNIKYYQLLGVELRDDIYMLAVLNMFLMDDGSTHLLNKDALDYSGNYEQGIADEKDHPFPANVFLLNPPYSAAGKGFVFVEKALSRMTNGRAAILIQENAGSGNGLPYTSDILKHNTLIASIKMPGKLFIGKANVQTGIYVFEVGTPHDINRLVKFIDFSNDGYSRQARKKANKEVNLRNTGDAKGRYQEVVDIILGNQKKTNYLKDCVFEDTISLNGKDWTVQQHTAFDSIPSEKDFHKTVSDYISWKISSLLKEETVNFL